MFLLVAATFSTIHLTQPVLPVLRVEFGIDAAKASLTVSAVIFGIALATLPFGRPADRFPARPIILSGGTAGITASGLAYRRAGWRGVVALVEVPVAAGILEARLDRPGSV